MSSAKVTVSFITGVLVGITLALGGAKLAGNKASSPGGDEAKAVRQVPTDHSPDKRPAKSGERAPHGEKELNTLVALNELARHNPALVRSLDLHLFNHNFEMIPADWEALGIPAAKAESLKAVLLETFERVHKLESENFQVLSGEGEALALGVPPLSDEAAAAIVDEIKGSFGGVFPDDLAALLAETYLKSNLPATGSLMGRGRILKIVPATPEEFKEIGFKYHLNTQVLEKNADFAKARSNPAGGVYSISDWPIFEIPASWRHLVTDE